MDETSWVLEMLTARKGGAPEAPVMTLPSVTLLPQEMLPLHIFEPQYRLMLAHVLAKRRMFVIAMQKPGSRVIPANIACLGIVRVCVQNSDGTSHLILQGLTRVELTRTVRTRPYRVHRLRALQAPNPDSVTIDALLAKVRDLVRERIDLGAPIYPAVELKGKNKRTIMEYLEGIEDPDEMADLVSRFFLSGPIQRQTILETVEVEPRLKHLIHFLMAEISLHQKKKKV